MDRHVISVLVYNNYGVLSRISGLFSRRGYNIDSVSSGRTTEPNISRLTIVVQGDSYVLEQINKQLNKLVDVIKVISLGERASVFRELVLLKVEATPATRAEISEVVDIFRAKIVDVAQGSMIVEITGAEDKVAAFIDLMRPHGIKEMVRTGLTALQRGDGAISDGEPETDPLGVGDQTSG